MKTKRSFASAALGGASRLFIFKQAIGLIGSVTRDYFEKRFGPAHEYSYARWKDRIQSLNLLLDAEPHVREKINRLMEWLYRQNRHEDLRSLQQFLTALDEPTKTGRLAQAYEAIARMIHPSVQKDATFSQRILKHLADHIGESGEEQELTEAVRFLESHRIIGFPPEIRPKGGISSKIAAQLREASHSLNEKAAWFTSHTRTRRGGN